MISPGDPYVRLELMHLLSIVVDGSSFCTHLAKKEAHNVLYIYYIENTLRYFRRHLNICGATQNNVSHCRRKRLVADLVAATRFVLIISKT